MPTYPSFGRIPSSEVSQISHAVWEMKSGLLSTKYRLVYCVNICHYLEIPSSIGFLIIIKLQPSGPLAVTIDILMHFLSSADAHSFLYSVS